MTNQNRLIATWGLTQDPATDAPVKLRWEDGTPATMEDFAQINSNTQSMPDINDKCVEFSYAVSPKTIDELGFSVGFVGQDWCVIRPDGSHAVAIDSDVNGSDDLNNAFGGMEPDYWVPRHAAYKNALRAERE